MSSLWTGGMWGKLPETVHKLLMPWTYLDEKQQVWSEALRKVVRSCYKHHGQEHRLQNTIVERQTKAEQDDVRLISMTDDSVSLNSDYKANMPALESRLPEPVPTSGPIPAKAVSGWKKDDFPNLAALPEAEAATVNDAQTDDKPFMEIFICFYCEKEFDDRHQLQGHQESCCPSRTRAKKTRRKVLMPRYKCKETHPDTYKRSNHKAFADAVGLIPRSKLAAFQKQKSREELKFDDIEIDECPIPKTPTTPRSAKSLMSQLSRDLSPPPSTFKLRRRGLEEDIEESVELKCKDDNKDTADAESVCSDKSDKTEFNMRKIPSLLAIDLCSPLGQRVKKHVDKLDSSERTEYEDFCHTPVKNNALDRLRNRPPLFPITFRKNKRLAQCHLYKFTKRDRREFMRVLATGLTKRARRLKLLIKPCSVTLHRLKEKDIVEWTTPRKHPRMIQQIRGGMQQGQMWQFVTQHDGRRVFINNPYQQQQMLMQQRGEQMMRMGPQYGMPLKAMNPTPHSLVQNRSYKAVLSNVGRQQSPLMPQGGVPPLNVYPLPLSCPSNNRNFGKPLQPGGFYGPSPMRGPAHGPSSRPFHRPNILSKENGAMRHNGTVRRLTMDSPAKSGDLSAADYLRQLPSSVPRKKPEDDVISISSSESESETVVTSNNNPRKRPHPEDRNNNSANKRPRLSAGGGNTQVVLFRCHLCQAEITCKLGQTDFIKKHFAEEHAVNNIHLLEHMDDKNQKVVTIVEDNTPKPSPKGGPGPTGRNPPRLSNGSDVASRKMSMGGRLGPGAISDRAVLRDSLHGHRRSSDGKAHRTNVIDSGPPEIIILD